ncbi:ABC transporter permease [Pedobacter psychrodurus]|uniref:ABC transporter permease n=1 Tax=Pedobacter psychrodurus TaxID=2530456 RepID=A0A4V2MR88_9SPHI|nr:Gldg family protein [Pedobacter psychrodurus]TCD28517.1 ABC transporter permease [Pedobacter psychrodurus]
MTKIFKIAKLELSILFYSPVAWIAIAIFMIQSGIGFFGLLGSYQEAISMGIPVDNLTFSLFTDLNSLFDTVIQNLYLYIPLITMGLMSRELQSGSIKLLLSAPVKIREIILGKYLSMVGYALILILILVIYAITGASIIKNPEIKLICSGLIGIFLLTCTYAAIGLFMSSLTPYQVVAAISTLAVFAALKFIGSVGQGIDFVRDLTYFLSISGRADDMLKGLITTRDVLYFLIIISLFLSLCIIRLKNQRESSALWIGYSRYAAIFICALMLGFLSSRPGLIGYLDMTRAKSRTLTKNSQKIVLQIDGPLEITTYVNLLDQNVYFGLPQSRNTDLAQFEKFQRFLPDLQMKYVYYYDVADLKNNKNMSYQGDITGLSTQQLAEKVADNMGLDLDLFMPPKEIRKIIDLSAENNSVVRVLKYKGQSSFLRFYDGVDQFPSEAEIAAAIKRLIVKVPKIAFVTGHHERSIDKTGDRNYQMMSTMRRNRKALINQGFDVVQLDLSKENIPDNLAALVIADPSIPVGDTEKMKINHFLAGGGNMLLTTEPGRQSIVNPLLKPLGLEVIEGMLVHPGKNDSPDLITSEIWNGKSELPLSGVSALRYKAVLPFKAEAMAISTAGGWNRTTPVDLTAGGLIFDPLKNDLKGAFPVIISLNRKIGEKDQRIVVSGDADFLNNIELSHPRGDNERFIKMLFSWFSYGDFPIDTSRQRALDNNILLGRKDISVLRTILLGAVPALILIIGAAVLIRRKRN